MQTKSGCHLIEGARDHETCEKAISPALQRGETIGSKNFGRFSALRYNKFIFIRLQPFLGTKNFLSFSQVFLGAEPDPLGARGPSHNKVALKLIRKIRPDSGPEVPTTTNRAFLS